MRASKFVLAGLIGVDGYTTGQKWNGWECPWLTMEGVQEVQNALLEGESKYQFACGPWGVNFTWSDGVSDGVEVMHCDPCECRTLETGVKVYQVGCGFTWEEV